MPRPKGKITNCPKQGGDCGKAHFAGGVCKTCYYASQRHTWDARYEKTDKARERQSRYEETEEGRARKEKFIPYKTVMMTHPLTGETKSLPEWAEALGLDPDGMAIRYIRFRRGELDEGSMFLPKQKDTKFTYGGESLTLAEWARKLNINVEKMHYRVDKYLKGEMTLERCFTPRKPYKRPRKDGLDLRSLFLGNDRE